MSKISLTVALVATAIAIPLAQKATAGVTQNSLTYVKLATSQATGNKATWRSPAFQISCGNRRMERHYKGTYNRLSVPSLAIPLFGSGKKQEVLSLPVGVIKESDIDSKKVSKKIDQVQDGDTLSAIAEHELVNLEDLINANNLQNPDRLAVGQQIIIPSSSEQSSAPKNFSKTTHPISPIAREKISVVAMATLGTGENRNYPIINRQITERWLQRYSNEDSIAIAQQQRRIINQKASLADLTKSTKKQPTSSKRFSTTKAARSLLGDPGDSLPTRNFSQSNRSQLVGTVSSTRAFNQRNARETGNPSLPPLSTPDNYLPNYPADFLGYIYPAKGTLTSGYGWRTGRMHKGIDIAAPIGTPVVAAATGRVVWAGWHKSGYGNLVKILHADGSLTCGMQVSHRHCR